jgi:hypothetical protein
LNLERRGSCGDGMKMRGWCMVLRIIINRFNKESANLNVQKPKEAVSFGWEKLSKFSISNFSALLFFVFLPFVD